MKTLNTNICKLHDIDMAATMDYVFDNSNKNQYEYIVTPNIDHLARLVDAESATKYKMLYDKAALCICDSRILKKLIKAKYSQDMSVVPGSDLTANLFNDERLIAKRVLIFGGENSVYEEFKTQYNLPDMHHINPSMGFINKPDEVSKLVDKVKQIRPDIIFLAVGSPRQEEFAFKLTSELKHGVALCIGASILFLTGDEKRAPKIMQKLSLEWLHRMFSDTRLFKRYLSNARSLVRIYRAL
ncbi:WecB/TagA/CpsF family glycosyltransferase [Glaciecola sp. KUL10]|uniref:WecB/TagA/CpsF family glycosyltransferase n=1 Tax=Glaciecola sp. (strain KUL10) TaxID=2161813 RepID=UPI000D78C138|nr:WecB/TagA/CpsF family glycosyltransferase [Glaciecola sp. KUL10]GBL04856.1 N-acetyl-mannosamine transferase [Glaciecola sp. KUL10]